MLFFDSSIQSDFSWFFVVFGGQVDPQNRVKMSSKGILRWLQLNSWKCTKTIVKTILLALSLLQHKLKNRWKTNPNPTQKPFKNRMKNQTLPTSIFHRFGLHLGAQDDSKIDEKSIPKVSRKINGCWTPSWTDFYRFYPPTEGQEAVREPRFSELCWLLEPRWPKSPPWRPPGPILKRFSMISWYQEPSTKVSGAVLGAIFDDFRCFFDDLLILLSFFGIVFFYHEPWWS